MTEPQDDVRDPYAQSAHMPKSPPMGEPLVSIIPDSKAPGPGRIRRLWISRGWRVPVLVALGGGIGSELRYIVESAIPVPAHGFPWGTLAINVTGSLALGLLMVYILEVWPPRRYLRPFVCVGIIGGFTTFSTYVAEVRDMAAYGLWSRADAYALTGLIAGLVAVWCGIVAGRVLGRVGVRPHPSPTHQPPTHRPNRHASRDSVFSDDEGRT